MKHEINKKLSKSKTESFFNLKQNNNYRKDRKIEIINGKPSIRDININKNENIRFQNMTMRNFNQNKEKYKNIIGINKTLENNSYYSTYKKYEKSDLKSDINEIYNDLRKYNNIVNTKLIELEKINEKKENNLKKEINDKNKMIEDLKNKIKTKNKELEMLKSRNTNLTEKCKEMQNKLQEIKNNESKYNDKDFKNLEEISSGGYGTLYSAFSIKDKTNICLKKINIKNMENQYKENGYPDKNYLKDLNNEIEILKLLSPYENSVKYYGDYQIIKEKIIIMEKCDEDFENYLKKRNKSLNVEEINKILSGLNKIFDAMNKNNVIHRDLKLKNLLIKYTNEEKLNLL